MRTEKEVREIMDEAVKIARDYPFLKLTEAVKVAEEIYEGEALKELQVLLKGKSREELEQLANKVVKEIDKNPEKIGLKRIKKVKKNGS